MINNEDRNSLINYHLQQANENIKLADFLIDSGKLIVAVNRFIMVCIMPLQH